MKSHQFDKIQDHPLRHLFRRMVNPVDMLPTRSELRAEIVEAMPDADPKVRDALYEQAIKLAKKAQEEGRGSWFDLRGAADEMVLKVVERMEGADRIIPAEPEPEISAEDMARMTDEHVGTIGEEANRAAAQEREAARELVRKAGL